MTNKTQKQPDPAQQLGWIYYFGMYVYDYYTIHSDEDTRFIRYMKKNLEGKKDISDHIENAVEVKDAVVKLIDGLFDKKPKFVEKAKEWNPKINLGVEMGNKFIEEIELQKLLSAYRYGKLGRFYARYSYKTHPDDDFIQYVWAMKNTEFDFEISIKNMMAMAFDKLDKVADLVILVKEFLGEKKEKKEND